MRFAALLLIAIPVGVVAPTHVVVADQVPGEECPCTADYDPPYPCFWELRCFASPALDQIEEVNPGSEYDRTRVRMKCDNCRNTQGRPGCSTSLSVTVTEEGSVTYGASFGITTKAEINLALAGSIGIQGTTEFRSGQTSSTSISETFTETCWVDDLPPCSRSDYWMEGWERRGHRKRAPVTFAWYYRIFGGPGCSPSGWILATACEQVRYSTIVGGPWFDVGCTHEEG